MSVREVSISWDEEPPEDSKDWLFVGMVVMSDDSKEGLPNFVSIGGIVYKKKNMEVIP